MAVAAKEPSPFDLIVDRGSLCRARCPVKPNTLDVRLCQDVYATFLRSRSKLYVYPVPAFVAPSLFVAGLLVNTFARSAGRKELVPRVLFYTGIDGRDLYRDLEVGPECQRISESFGFLRLNADGVPIDRINLTSKQPLVVTGHCTLPKDVGYRPDVVVIDARGFESEQLASMIDKGALRWPHALFFAITPDPLTPLVKLASKLRWELLDLLRDAPRDPGGGTRDPDFSEVAKQLGQAAAGIAYSISTVAETPSGAWAELEEPTRLARKLCKTSQAARQFLSMQKWLASLAVLPSEFEAYRLSSMIPFEERLVGIRDQARKEGRSAQLIAGGVNLLRDVRDQLEARNWKREALLESILEYCYAGKRMTVLVQRPGMRAILSQAVQLLPECADMLDNNELQFVSANQVTKARLSDTVVVPAVLNSDSIWALRTAIAPNMLILAYGMESRLQEWCLKEVGLLAVTISLTAPLREDEGNAPKTEEFAIELADLLPIAEPEEDRVTRSSTYAGPRRLIRFDDGTSITVPETSTVNVVTGAEEPLLAKRPSSLRAGDTIIVVNGDALQPLFEVLRDRVDTSTSLSRAIEVVRAFQLSLESFFRKANVTVEELHQRLVAKGSLIQHSTSVMQWVDGTRFGPSDPFDIARLGSILEVALFRDRHTDFYRAMQRVRIAHRELGKIIVRVLQSVYLDADSQSVKISVEGEVIVLYDVLDAIALKRVLSTSEV
jgi:hypothetical protein